MIQEYLKTPGNFLERQRFHFINFASETFLEATPTIFLQIIIIVTILSKNITVGELETNQFIGDNTVLYVISLSSSFLSSSFGISRY